MYSDILALQSAMLLTGRGVVCENVFWGNAKKSAIEVSIENLDKMNINDLQVC